MSVPARMRLGKRWFEGSADAVYQILNLLTDEDPDYICIFGADHIYRMDPEQMVEAHIQSGAGVTVAGIRVPRDEASRFGVIEPGPNGRIKSFQEKPKNAPGLPDNPNEVFASMGNCLVSKTSVVDAVTDVARDVTSRHDMGGYREPSLLASGDAAADASALHQVPGATERDPSHGRDVGTHDS